ncbi:MAG: sensor histidine kinase, partial [Candidatus Dormibacteraeota bacterium]|nr:sensor histidine kinase [Candidatus Dormibacteraeota bacterium]
MHHLHESLRHPEDGRPDCVLVRFYRTVRYERLPTDLQSFARATLGPESPRPDMKCLTLMATAGDLPEWNSRHTSA